MAPMKGRRAGREGGLWLEGEEEVSVPGPQAKSWNLTQPRALNLPDTPNHHVEGAQGTPFDLPHLSILVCKAESRRGLS